MLKLIKWMRNYNITHHNILEFKGLDIQTICDNNNNNNNNNKNDSISKYVKKKFTLNNKINQDDWVAADGFRDKSMFDVFMKIYDPAKKYFIYAHEYQIHLLLLKTYQLIHLLLSRICSIDLFGPKFNLAMKQMI